MAGDKRIRYNFSKDADSTSVSLVISEELNDRIVTLCNITELTKSSICRYLLKRGVTDMEAKMVELTKREVA